MSEKMIAVPIRIGTWEGEAFLIDGAWHVAMGALAQHLGFTYENHRRRFTETFPDATQYLNTPGEDGQLRARAVAPLDCVLQWMFWLGGSGRMQPESAAKVAKMREALSARLAAAILSDSLIAPVSVASPAPGVSRAPADYASTVGRSRGFLRLFAALLRGGRNDA